MWGKTVMMKENIHQEIYKHNWFPLISYWHHYQLEQRIFSDAGMPWARASMMWYWVKKGTVYINMNELGESGTPVASHRCISVLGWLAWALGNPSGKCALHWTNLYFENEVSRHIYTAENQRRQHSEYITKRQKKIAEIHSSNRYIVLDRLLDLGKIQNKFEESDIF